MKLTQKQVEMHYRNENYELLFATEKQIDKLCTKLGSDEPRMHWDMCKDDMQELLDSARREFANVANRQDTVASR